MVRALTSVSMTNVAVAELPRSYTGPMAGSSDLDTPVLVEQARAGDTAAFTALVRLHEQRVLGICRRMLADQREAEECAQDAFVQAWRHLDRFQDRARFSTWIHRIAVNEALQRLRRRRHAEVSIDDPSGGASVLARVEDWTSRPEAQLDQLELRRVLAERLTLLPDPVRAAVVLRDVEGYSNQEVAELLEVSLEAAKARIHRGRMRIRADLQAWFGDRRG
jgi:RNA polymerase sigma-70 factor, ECF subfamily